MVLKKASVLIQSPLTGFIDWSGWLNHRLCGHLTGHLRVGFLRGPGWIQMENRRKNGGSPASSVKMSTGARRSSIEIPLRDSTAGEVLEVFLDELPDAPEEIAGILADEQAPLSLFFQFAVRLLTKTIKAIILRLPIGQSLVRQTKGIGLNGWPKPVWRNAEGHPEGLLTKSSLRPWQGSARLSQPMRPSSALGIHSRPQNTLRKPQRC